MKKIIIMMTLIAATMGTFIGCGDNDGQKENNTTNTIQEYVDNNTEGSIIHEQMFSIYDSINKLSTSDTVKDMLNEELDNYENSFSYTRDETEIGFDIVVSNDLGINVIIEFVESDEQNIIDKVIYQDYSGRIIAKDFKENGRLFVNSNEELYLVENTDMQREFISTGKFKGIKL